MDDLVAESLLATGPLLAEGPPAARRPSSSSFSPTASRRSPPKWATCCGPAPSRPTCATASTTPAGCSTPRASWWSTRRTSRSTSGRSAVHPRACGRGAPSPLGPGDVAITNHPAFGGSHLPDVTLISPVLGADGARLGFVANRGPPRRARRQSRRARCRRTPATWPKKGVVFAPRLLVEAGRSRFAEVAALLAEGPLPSRAPEENLADLEAALAANRAGARALEALAARHGEGRVAHLMARQKAEAARRLELALRRLPPGELAAEEFLDDGHRIAVRATIYDGEGGRRLELDFGGSSGVHPGNLNATPAIVRSAVLYVLRLLLAEDLPLNERAARAGRAAVAAKASWRRVSPPIRRFARRSSAAMTGISQRLVDTLVKAFGLLACGQGTMNNVLFGDGSFGYYETLCGGAGAGPGFAGASAVRTHMTNTRITDPEILERRYPVRLEKFAIRRGSGGAGRWPGGDGARREIQFLRRLELSLLAQHPVEAPFGMRRRRARRLLAGSGSSGRTAPSASCRASPRPPPKPATCWCSRPRAAAAGARPAKFETRFNWAE